MYKTYSHHCYQSFRFIKFIEKFIFGNFPTHPPIQWVPGALSVRVKRVGREADHSPPSSAEVKEYMELYLHSPYTPSWRGTQLKHRENLKVNLPTDLNEPLKVR
jgi:hypothetical protein